MTAKPRHEHADAPPKLVALAIAGFISLIGLGALVAWGLAAGFHTGPQAPVGIFDRALQPPPAPRLEVDARADRIAIEHAAEAKLTGYAWADRQAGLVRIPIERAMALQAAAGWPDADTGPDTGDAAASAAPSAAKAER